MRLQSQVCCQRTAAAPARTFTREQQRFGRVRSAASAWGGARRELHARVDCYFAWFRDVRARRGVGPGALDFFASIQLAVLLWRLRRLARCWNIGRLSRCVAQPLVEGVRIQYDA